MQECVILYVSSLWRFKKYHCKPSHVQKLWLYCGQSKTYSSEVQSHPYKPDDVQAACVHFTFVSKLSGLSPAKMKITPPARATLSFCAGVSDIQVVHLMPTISTKIPIRHSKIEHSISPRVPSTIPGDKNI